MSSFIFTEDNKRLGFVDLSNVAAGTVDLKAKIIKVFSFDTSAPILIHFNDSELAKREFLRIITELDEFTGILNFTFKEDDELLAFVYLPSISGALEDWGNGYLHLYLFDTSETMSIYFKSDKSITKECERMLQARESFKKQVEEAERAYIKH